MIDFLFSDVAMNTFMLAAIDGSTWGGWLLAALYVALGLGFVIFVHELGHFAVAKMCGVKCEKFMVGFDIGGYKIAKQWGETLYGIGILPMGGYVKMLGQDDNPANIAEQVRESQASAETEHVATTTITGPDGEKYEVDSRSYLAKSVPQRMAIISAGVIMNIIFAFIFAVIAFGVGVPYAPSIVSRTSPGSPAWEAGIRPGDEIVRVGDIVNPSFSELSQAVTLGDMENGLKFEVRRDGETKPMNLAPRKIDGKLAKIGVGPPISLKIFDRQGIPAAFEGTPGAVAQPAFEGGDRVVGVDGTAVDTYAQFTSILAQRPEKTLTVTVIRGEKPPKGDPEGEPTGGEEVNIEVGPNPMRELGLIMEMGRIVAVQKDSPADRDGISPGDFLADVTDASGNPLPGLSDASTGDAVNDEWGPLTLPETLRQLAATGSGEVMLKIRHDSAEGEGRQPSQTVIVPLRPVQWSEESLSKNDPVAVPALGIAYRVLNRVAAVAPNSPAAAAGLKPGDTVTAAQFVFPPQTVDGKTVEVDDSEPTEFNDQDEHNWPAFLSTLQRQPEGTKVKLTLKREGKEVTETLDPAISTTRFNPERGLNFATVQRVRKSETFGEQVSRGWDETVGALGMVYRFLHKLIDGQVPATALGGPVTIAKAAGYSAMDGVGKLLVFLTMLSANLAVINFLPIPLLDGGHMVFLGYEGIRGRPASEKFVVALHTVGFVAIISLMVFVLSLDFGLIPRNL
ncbi:site-2 protease family protein [Adhaeretor mobilis]|uniref:Regulator of sigma-E protease RseP n=1 Tax=Adhaeretor mobilis TaxID=1930276 RepID=A0A517MQU4_9BACT|nr:site-2 protease family protein [Adhaeretor mobilis]QDS97251.1 Regulator of sigma-E protease RseP [Adhaeretor mobilis]